jgi:LysR family transcriptional regulator, transcriptional activator for bauABCD operon
MRESQNPVAVHIQNNHRGLPMTVPSASPSIEDRFSRNLDWNLLFTFHVIVQAGNLTRAATRLGRKQPAISLALRRLEGHLGTALCSRTSNRFELTPEGMLVAQVCSELFQQVRALPNRLANLPAEVVGHLRIASITSISSPRLDRAIAEFHRQCPKVQIEIDIVSWEEVTRRLKKQTADIGIAPARFLDAIFHYTLLYSEPIRIYCGRTHPLFGQTFTSPDELGEHGIILTGGDEPDVIRRYRLEHGLGRVIAGESGYLDEAKRLAIQGVGLCFLPEPLAKSDVEVGNLWPLLPDSEGFTSDIYAISLPVEQMQLPARMFENVLASI